MNGKQRVQRMFQRKDHDRVPRFDGFWGDTIDRWQREGLEGGSEEVFDRLGADLYGICFHWPHPFGHREDIVEETEDTKVVRDGSGALLRFWKNRDGVPEHIGQDCDSREKWETVYKPALAKMPLDLSLDDRRKRLAAGRSKSRWCYLAGVSAYEFMRRMLGDELFMISILDDPDWIADIAREVTDATLRFHQAMWDGGLKADGFWIYEDLAFRNMPFCSPEAYKELIWPQHRRLADWAHERGLPFIFHTDGDVRKLMDLFVEGHFDALQPLEAKANMDVRKLAPVYGDRLAFFGNIDVTVMITNDMEAIEEEIATKLAAVKPTRGYIYHSDHSVPPQVSWETYQGIIRLLEKYGTY